MTTKSPVEQVGALREALRELINICCYDINPANGQLFSRLGPRILEFRKAYVNACETLAESEDLVKKIERVQKTPKSIHVEPTCTNNEHVGAQSLRDISAISAMIGYCQSLEAGTVITQEYIDRLNSYYVPNLQRFQDRIMGASAVSDTADLSAGNAHRETASAEAPTTIHHEAKDGAKCPSVFGSEISVNEEMRLRRELALIIKGSISKTRTLSAEAWSGAFYLPEAQAIIEHLRPYLRTPKPVSVSLEKCASRLYCDTNRTGMFWPRIISWGEFKNKKPFYEDAKAVLDAAGVEYDN